MHAVGSCWLSINDIVVVVEINKQTDLYRVAFSSTLAGNGHVSFFPPLISAEISFVNIWFLSTKIYHSPSQVKILLLLFFFFLNHAHSFS